MRKKNFTACVNPNEAPQKFHNLMRFLGQCNMSYTMTEEPILLCEVIEEVWTTDVFKSTNKVITFNLKGNSYVNGDILSSCLHLSANTHVKQPSETEIRRMLNEVNYVVPNANLGKIVRKTLEKNGAISLAVSSRCSQER